MRVQAYHPWHHRSGVALPGRALLLPPGMAPRWTQCQVPEERTPAIQSYNFAVHATSSHAIMRRNTGTVRQLFANIATLCHSASTAAVCHNLSRHSHLFKALSAAQLNSPGRLSLETASSRCTWNSCALEINQLFASVHLSQPGS
jgi:hypothetical protein